MMKYELWYSRQENSYTLCKAGGEHANWFPPDARCIWIVEANSWEEAQMEKHIYLGWEPYKPIVDSLTNQENAYSLILRRSPAEIHGLCALYEYTALIQPQFNLVHTAENIGALLDWMREWLHPEIADELAYDEDFWHNADADILAIEDTALRAFIHYTCNKPIAPVYAYEQCLYMEGLLDDLPGWRFVIAWEARAPRQDVAYAIVECVL